MPFLTYMTWLLIGLIVAGLAAACGRLIRLRRLPLLLVAMLAMCATLALLYLFTNAAKPSPVAVTITSPQSGQEVIENQVRVTGKVNKPDARVTLVVRSEKDFRWWVQKVVTPQREKDRDGSWKWSINAQLGTREAGKDENFQIIALASADSSLFNLITGRGVSENSTFKTIPLWEQSEPIVVRRINDDP